ncbi:hypothetical protein P7C71_g2118, partial [Lecanoromycetidae sp. Uapishka_2]
MSSISSEGEQSCHSCTHCKKDAILLADRDRHKYACKKAQDRRAMYRAGATAQLVFFRYLEKFETIGVTKVEKKGDDIYIYLPDADDDNPEVFPFVWKECNSEEDRLTLLTYMMCGNSTGFAHVLMDILLLDTAQQVAQITHQPKAYRRRVIAVQGDGYHVDNTDSKHCINRVTLTNGEVYAVDLTGPQYGFYDPVIPWEQYCDSRVKAIDIISLLRDVGECQKVAGSKAGGVGPDKTREEEFAEVFVAAAKSWQVTNGPLDGMLRLREKTFKKKQASLVDFIDEELIKHKDKTGSIGLPDSIVSEGFNY